jgi:hypothetical protein
VVGELNSDIDHLFSIPRRTKARDQRFAGIVATEKSAEPEAEEVAFPKFGSSASSTSTKDVVSQDMSKALYDEGACVTQMELLSGCPPSVH